MREALFSNAKILSEHDEIWDCTTCQTCTIRCPRGLKPHELIMNIRSSLIEEGRIAETVSNAFENVFKHGNPWGKSRSERAQWAADLGIKDITRGDKVDLLLFVGCAPSYDSRVQEVTKTLTKCLTTAEVNFGILGTEESCCGSELRRMGESGLFEMLMQDNLNLFNKYGITRIVTISPHCFNTFKNEYQNNAIKVQNYTQYLEELIQAGKFNFSRKVDIVATYHDPCYLGKQNSIFDAPRNIIKAIPGVKFIDFDRSREKSLCCEGGGGRMFVEASDTSKVRLAVVRVKDAVEMGVNVVATACPFCLLNLDDAVKTAGCECSIQIKDIAELLSEAIN